MVLATSRPSRLATLLALVLLLSMLVGASPGKVGVAVPRAFLPAVEPGCGALHGTITGWPDTWPRDPVGIWLATYWPLSEDGASGVLVLEPSTTPWRYLDKTGAYTFGPIAPGRYGLVVGTTPLFMVPVRNEYGRAAVFTVLPGNDLDVGAVSVH